MSAPSTCTSEARSGVVRPGLKLLYIGQARSGTNGGDRIATLERLGCEVTVFDTRPENHPYSKVERRFATRFNAGRPIFELNCRLLDFIGGKRFDIAWVNKAVWLQPRTVRKISETSGAMLHFTLDSQFSDNRSHLLFKSIPLFDLMVTTKAFEVDEYRARGARNVFVVRQAYSRRITDAANAPPDPRFDSDVTFVGHYQPYYGKVLKAVAATGVDLKIWGPNWPEYAKTHPWAGPLVQGDGLWGTDYACALRQAKITLCLLSKRIGETSTTRSMEIPAAGGFMLTEHTSEHEALYEDGREAVFFSDIDELLALIDRYLGDVAARTRIAAAGAARASRSGYSEQDQTTSVLQHVLLIGRSAATTSYHALDADASSRSQSARKCGEPTA